MKKGDERIYKHKRSIRVGLREVYMPAGIDRLHRNAASAKEFNLTCWNNLRHPQSSIRCSGGKTTQKLRRSLSWGAGQWEFQAGCPCARMVNVNLQLSFHCKRHHTACICRLVSSHRQLIYHVFWLSHSPVLTCCIHQFAYAGCRKGGIS